MMDNSAFMENLKQLFAECDVDNNGCLGREEFSELCAKIGLNKEAAHETFDRLDMDRDNKITFAEFAAGFNQYNKSAAGSPTATTTATTTTTTTTGQPLPKKPLSTAGSSLGRKSARPVGVLSLGAGSSGTSSSSSNLLGLNKTTNSRGSAGGCSADISDFNGDAGGGSGSLDTAASSSGGFYAPAAASGQQTNGLAATAASSRATTHGDDSMIVYSSEQDFYDQPASSGQFGSLFGGGAGSLNGTASGSGSFSQVRNMQELLDCVQKLQSENQILTQIFFKDKREREEYISQLGEEFDQQVREVEERANRRAREELENEKKRLREMMQTERETLQHHYKTIEKMSKIIQAPQGSRSSNDLLLDGEGIDKVKSKLEDTYLENRQLKRSLLDTKTDVAMIWKEMEKLKKQYEDKLSSAYEKNNETRNECDHIKQQLTLMKDSNRRLQDASDVITTYITDKVEPVIKGASANDDQFLSPASNGGGPGHSLTGPGTSSQSHSRRGSVLSEYLNSQPDSMEDDGDDDESLGRTTTNLAALKQQQQQQQQQQQNKAARLRTGRLEVDLDGYDARSSTASSLGSSAGGGGGTLPRINLPQPSSGLAEDGKRDHQIKKSSSLNPLTTNSADTIRDDQRPASSTPEFKQDAVDEAQKARARLQTTSSQLDVSKAAGSRGSSLKNLGRHFFLGSRDRLSTTTTTHGDPAEAHSKQPSKSMSLDHGSALSEPLVEPADGPSVATFNIILVGDSFVGKSSFAARFMEGSFVQGLISNCSIDFKTKAYKVDGINYTVNLWDTAGQERFRSITASYFRKADGIILMYDVTDKRSYLNVRNWMSTISDTASENVAVLLVGNKIDLREERNKDKCVPLSEGFRLAKEYDIVFLETSVKTGTNLIPSMGRLIRLIAKNNSPEEKDDDTIKLNDKNRTFHCMPKNC